MRDKIPCLVITKSLHLLVYLFDTSWVLCGFHKAFKFIISYHLHHKGIVICHIVVVVELANQIIFSGGAMKFFVCYANNFLHSRSPHMKRIRSTKLSIEWVSQYWRRIDRLHTLHFGLPFVPLWTQPRCASVPRRLLRNTQSGWDRTLLNYCP